MAHNPTNGILPSSNEPDPSMRWFLLVLIALWIFTAMLLAFIAFCVTRNPYSFSLFGTLAPPFFIIYRIAKNLFPPSDNDTKIALAKQQRKSGAAPRMKPSP